MTPKERAQDIVYKMQKAAAGLTRWDAIQCARVMVRSHIPQQDIEAYAGVANVEVQKAKFWQAVLKELDKL